MNCKKGDLLKNVTKGLIVHQVNAQGVMGHGIAGQIREKWPHVFAEYSSHIPKKSPDAESFMGRVIYVEAEPGLWVANLVGQLYYGRASILYTSYEALAAGFENVRDFAENHGLDIHYPKIGCGLANGDWTIVSRIIDEKLVKMNHTFWDYTPE